METIQSIRDKSTGTQYEIKDAAARNSINGKLDKNLGAQIGEKLLGVGTDGNVKVVNAYTAGNGISIVDGVISINLPRAEEATF